MREEFIESLPKNSFWASEKRVPGMLLFIWASMVAQRIKNLLTMQEDLGSILGPEDPLEKRMATHSSILAWRISMVGGAWWATVHRIIKSRT